jgi:ribosomal protein L11 methyltransferase
VIGELYEAGTAGIRELESDGQVLLIAGFETNELRETLLQRFGGLSPEWTHEADIDWVQVTRDSWQPQNVGDRIWLAPAWSEAAVPSGRLAILHNPGLACGTGEHPCTRLALQALERYCSSGSCLADIGTGSGLLAIAGIKLGADSAYALDIDEAALSAAHENFALNDLSPVLIAGSADCLRDGVADVTVANISATVLLNILDEIVRITRPDGYLILTGFPEAELPAVQRYFEDFELDELDGWSCLAAKPSSFSLPADL